MGAEEAEKGGGGRGEAEEEEEEGRGDAEEGLAGGEGVEVGEAVTGPFSSLMRLRRRYREALPNFPASASIFIVCLNGEGGSPSVVPRRSSCLVIRKPKGLMS